MLCRMYLTSILMPLICLDASEAQGYRRLTLAQWILTHWYYAFGGMFRFVISVMTLCITLVVTLFAVLGHSGPLLSTYGVR